MCKFNLMFWIWVLYKKLQAKMSVVEIDKIRKVYNNRSLKKDQTIIGS